MRPAVLLALVAILSGCAAVPVNSAARSRMQRVGIVSVLGDTIHGEFVGTTVFGNRSYNEQAPDFALDSTAVQTAAESIRPVFAHVQVTDRGSLAAPEFKSRFLEGYTLWKPASSETAAAVRSICAARRLDTLLVVYPGIQEGPYTPVLPGIGIYAKNTLGLETTATYSVIGLAIYDGATGKPLPWRAKEAIPAKPQQIFKSVALKSIYWKESLGGYSASEREELRQQIRTQITESVREALSMSGMARER